MDIALKEGTGFSAEMTILLRERLEKLRRVDPKTCCWMFVGAKSADGYGLLWIGQEHYFVHRLMYELDKGKIPAGKLVLHTCPGGDRPACFNPGHLRAGTGKENAADREQRKTGGA